MRLHTLSIRPDDRSFDLVWSGALRYAGYQWLPNLKRLDARVRPGMSDAVMSEVAPRPTSATGGDDRVAGPDAGGRAHPECASQAQLRYSARRPRTRAEIDRPLVSGDQPWGNPLNSTTRYESDFVPFKLGTDVVFDAFAHAPGGVPAPAVLVGVRVAGRERVLQVFGSRVARLGERGDLVFTAPVRFETMEIRYEFAYGGIDVFSDRKVAYPYPRNPLGRGFVIARRAEMVDSLDLPNIEDAADL